MIARCVGACCYAFYLPFDGYAGLLAAVVAEPNRYTDGAKIVDMVIPRFPRNDETASRFGCRHFDFVTKECKIYDERPDMCRRHGEEYACDMKDCPIMPAYRERLSQVPRATVAT